MKQEEKIKAQKIIDKIETGNFDENDIDSLFMKLRPYSYNLNLKIFLEIADLVAHNNNRSKGVINTALEAFYLRMKFLSEYDSQKRHLDISKPFPSWVKTLMIYQVDRCKINTLKDKYDTSPQELKKEIEENFIKSKIPKFVELKRGASYRKLFHIIKYILSIISTIPSFTQKEIINETLTAIQRNKLSVNNDVFLSHSSRFILCTLLLFNNTTYTFDKKNKNPQVRTFIAPDKFEITLTPEEEKHPSRKELRMNEFGKLGVTGSILLMHKGKRNPVAYKLIETELDVYRYCHENIFHISSLPDNQKKIIFPWGENVSFSISPDNKIVKAN